MPNKSRAASFADLAHALKRCHVASREAMESMLRPYDLGTTQWYVLHRLAEGPAMQRELVTALNIERATLSAVVSALVRKGLVEQAPDQVDQRRRLLTMTPAGSALWKTLPDLSVIRTTAFDGFSAADLAVATRVLDVAAGRLETFNDQETPTGRSW